MDIKDTQVHAMAKQLATGRGTAKTNAVQQALSAEVERSKAADAAQQKNLQSLLDASEGCSGRKA